MGRLSIVSRANDKSRLDSSLKGGNDCTVQYLIVSLDKLAVTLVILPLFDSLVFFQLLVLNPSAKLVVQQVLVLSLLQAHELRHRVNPRNSPDVLLLPYVQILVMKKVVCFHEPG